MGAPTKAEKFCKQNFEIITNEDDRHFSFNRIEHGAPGYVVSFDTYATLKEACQYVFDSEMKKEATPQESAPEQNPESRLNDFLAAAKKYPTDKENHGYIPLYAEKLPSNPKNILEIGCYKGNSIRMWRELFPAANISTLDLFQEYPIPSDIEGVQYFKGSQSDTDLLDVLAGYDFDVVIDDGSHGAKDQWLTVQKFLKPGVVVVIEDLHCNFDGNGFWNQGLPESETILGRIKAGTFDYKHEVFLDKIVFIYG